MLQNIRTTEIKNDGDQVLLVTENETYRFDALLYSTGRKPNVEPLQLENTDIELTERGAIKVDKHCQTNRSWCLCCWRCQRWPSIYLHFT